MTLIQYKPEYGPIRLDLFLLQHAQTGYSRTYLQRLIKDGFVQVDGLAVTSSSYLLERACSIILTLPAADPLYPVAEPGELDILYEDQWLLAINKPVGLVVHPVRLSGEGTLVNLLLAHYPELTDAVVDPENPVSRMRPGIVHRLDKDTSGVMVIAKTQAVLLALSDQIRAHGFTKQYLTLLFGELKAITPVDAPLVKRGSDDHYVMRASHIKSEGRAAFTQFTPLETRFLQPAGKQVIPLSQAEPTLHLKQSNCFTVVEAQIMTGRTHQIRAHAKFIGHPVLGDQIYGHKPSLKLSAGLGLTSQALHSAKLGLTHPVTRERLELEAPLKASWRQLL